VVKWQCLIGALAVTGFLIFHRLIFSLVEIEDFGSTMLLLSIGMILLNILWQTSAMFHKVAELKTSTMQLVVALSFATIIVYAGLYMLFSKTNLLQIFGVFCTGFVVYFLITVFLFYSYKWPADHTNETI